MAIAFCIADRERVAMSDCIRLPRTRLIAAVLALGFFSSIAAAAPFRATGVEEIAFFRGTVVEGVSSGFAQPGGQFTSVWSGRVTGHKVVGVETWDFGGGDTLTFATEMEFSHGQATGTYVITGGTGRFEGASGSADYSRFGHGDGTADFVIEGTISR
jgi:hypothetical protein